MAVQVQKVDFSYFRGLVLNKVFLINEVVNGVVQPYDMTGKVINLEMRDRSNVPVLLYTIAGVVGVGTVSFPFTNLQTDLVGIADYQIIENPALLLQYGSANFTLAQDFMPFGDLVVNELPPGLVLPAAFIALKATEWRLYLQKAITPPIANIDVQNEAAWPILVNILIAKLVVFDFIIKSIKSLIAGSTLQDVGSGANIKKVETGPSNVEFHDPFAALAKFFNRTKYGTPLQAMAIDICQLARRLRVYLPICENPNMDATIPLKAERTPTPTVAEFLISKFGI